MILVDYIYTKHSNNLTPKDFSLILINYTLSKCEPIINFRFFSILFQIRLHKLFVDRKKSVSPIFSSISNNEAPTIVLHSIQLFIFSIKIVLELGERFSQIDNHHIKRDLA